MKHRRIFCILIALILAAGGTVFATVFAADNVVLEKISVDYEDGKIAADSVSEATEAVVTEKDAIGGARSLLVYGCDMAWESLSLSDYIMNAEFKVKCDPSFQGKLDLCFDTEGVGGGEQTILSVTQKEGALSLTAADKTLYTLSYNTVYKILVSLQRGSSSYSISVNDTKLDTTVDLPGNTYGINGIRFKMQKAEDGSFLMLDDFKVYAQSRGYPQPYSAQATGEIPDPVIPQAGDPETWELYINGTKIHFLYNILVKDETVFVPAERLFESVGMTFQWDRRAKSVTLTNDNINMAFSADSNIATINGNNIVLTAAPFVQDDEVYVPLNLINEAMNAKVWWDESSNLIVVTAGKAKSDHVLQNIRGRFYMDGEPYYEISFLYEGLFRTIWEACRNNGDRIENTEPYREADRVLARMNELGFRSVRTYMWDNGQFRAVQSASDREVYFKAVTAVMDLCDQHGIRLIPCLGLNSKMFVAASYVKDYGWAADNETVMELVCDRNSVSRGDMTDFLDEFIKRYKERSTVLMWELCDAANLAADCGAANGTVAYSLSQLGHFYGDCADRIRSVDPSRLISGGDAMLRPAQWHLFSAVMNGSSEDWTYDTTRERLQALSLLTEKLDVLSVHAFDVGLPANAESYCSDEDGNKIQLTFSQLVKEAKQMGKVLYNGATNGALDHTGSDNTSESLLSGQQKYLDALVESGIQISHWQLNNGEVLNSAFFDKNTLSKAVSDANARLHQRYLFNKAYADNTNQSWSDSSFDVFDPAGINPGNETVLNLTFLYGMIKVAAAVVTATALLLFILFAMKRKENSLKRGS